MVWEAYAAGALARPARQYLSVQGPQKVLQVPRAAAVIESFTED
jgi:hypothetical protein